MSIDSVQIKRSSGYLSRELTEIKGKGEPITYTIHSSTSLTLTCQCFQGAEDIIQYVRMEQ